MNILAASTGDVSLLTYEERCDLAEGPSTPPETLALLAKDEQWTVRSCVADNPNTPPETLALLAKDAYAGVRMCAQDTLSYISAP